jgi:hypothetical protein
MSNADLDQRDGIRTAWITATNGDRVLTAGELKAFTQQAEQLWDRMFLSVRTSRRQGVPCILIRGDRRRRNNVLTFLAAAFYTAGYKWLWTASDFDWLKAQLQRA